MKTIVFILIDLALSQHVHKFMSRLRTCEHPQGLPLQEFLNMFKKKQEALRKKQMWFSRQLS